MIVKWPKGIQLRIGEKGPVFTYKGTKYQPKLNPNDPFGMVVVKIAPNEPVNFETLGDYSETQILSDHGIIEGVIEEKKEVVNENNNSKPAKG